jgi:hypothetical protein
MGPYKIKKELNKYIKECLGKGYSLRAIHKALKVYGYEDYADELIKNYNIKRNISIAIPVVTLILLISGLFFFESTITGFLTVEKQFNYSDTINLNFEQNSEYIWIPENKGLLKSLKLSGSYKTEGNVKVYLEDKDVRYLIFDSSKLSESGITGITGLVVSNESNNEGNNSIMNETTNQTIINDTSVLNETLIENETTVINETNQTINITPIINETIQNITINKTIAINLEYKKDTIYDVDNDGIEDIYNVIDLTVEHTEFNWPVDESKLCTRWNIFAVEEETSTTICYGNQNCCAFVDLVPSKQEWNSTLFLTYGLYESSYNNKVSAQVVHVDFNLSLENPYSEIYYSSWEELPVKFYTPFTSFENICIETCSLSLNKSSYKLIIEVNNSILKLDKINYVIQGKAENNPPVLVKNISNLKLTENNLTINLSEYFKDIDEDLLSFSYYKAENITINIENYIATIIPDKSFTGIVYLFFTANDSYETAVSNVFSINISKEVKEQINRSRVVINKPVKWVKKVKLDKVKSNISVNITSFATNITVKKISENIKEKIHENKIKIKYKEKIKTLKQYEIEKEIEKREKEKNKETSIEKIEEIENKIEVLKQEKDKISAVSLITGNVILENVPNENVENSTEIIIEDLVQEVEIEYYTEGPTSEEIEISDHKKQIIVSSDIHYEDILAYTNLPIEVNSEAVKLYWLVNDSKIEVNIDKFDTNENNLIDYIEWIVPSLSNQTYELSITILNVQSYPTLFGNWTVRFNTTGTGNLTISASNGTTFTEIYDNSGTEDDLEFFAMMLLSMFLLF